MSIDNNLTLKLCFNIHFVASSCCADDVSRPSEVFAVEPGEDGAVGGLADAGSGAHKIVGATFHRCFRNIWPEASAIAGDVGDVEHGIGTVAQGCSVTLAECAVAMHQQYGYAYVGMVLHGIVRTVDGAYPSGVDRRPFRRLPVGIYCPDSPIEACMARRGIF